MTEKVFVVDANGTPLLPTRPSRARKLLNAGKARVYRVVPFAIQLNCVVDKPVGEFQIGIDDGAKTVGLGIVNEITKEEVFRADIELRQDVKRKITQRAQYRRNRRSRKVRSRRWRPPGWGDGWLPPTIRQKKDSIIRVIDDLSKLINITGATVEQGAFDTHSMSEGKKLNGKEYQIPRYEGRSFRAKVLWRDKYTCQHCGKPDCKLQAHHIRHRSNGGSDHPDNGITLCEKCHADLHVGKWVLDKKPKELRYPAHLQQGKNYLRALLEERFERVLVCYGFETAYYRQEIGMEKTHAGDAIAMVAKDFLPIPISKTYAIKPRRKKVWENNPTKTTDEKNGFRHYDVVKAVRAGRIVIGSIRSLKAKVMTLRIPGDDNFAVSYNKSHLLWRPESIIYI